MAEFSNLAFSVVRRLLAMPTPLADLIIRKGKIERDGLILDRRVQLLLAIAGMKAETEPGDHDLATHRNELDRLGQVGMPLLPGVRVTERLIPGPGGTIPIRIYRRYGIADDSPGILYLHGGGWVRGSLDSHEGSCRILALESHCVVVSVDYRLAPEHPFPAAVEDSVAAYRWVQNHAEDLMIQPGVVGVMGDSAGGNLAAVIAQVTKDTDVPAPSAQCLVYPSTSAHFNFKSHDTFATGFFLTSEAMHWYRNQYVPNPSDWDSPLVSPLLSDDFSGLPPTIVITAGFDPLRDEGRAYADELTKAGVPVTYRCYDDTVHGFFGMGVIPGGIDTAVEISQMIGDVLHVAANVYDG